MNLTITTLRDRPELFDQTILLIESSLKYERENSYAVDFYPLMSERNHHHCHIILNEENLVVAHIGFLIKSLQSDIPIVLIGGVCIHKDYQGKGLTNIYFKSLIEFYKKNCALMALWSELNDFYEKLQFYECGEILQTGILELNLSNLKDFIYLDWSDLSNDKILWLEKLRFETAKDALLLKRTHEDWEDIKKIKSSKLYVSKDAYFIIGKGQDLNGVIHEYGALNIDEFILRFKDYKLWLYNKNKHTTNYHQSLYAGLFSIGEISLFKDLVTVASNGEIKKLKLTSNHTVGLEFKGRLHRFNTKEFLQALWGPKRKAEFKNFNSLIISGVESV